MSRSRRHTDNTYDNFADTDNDLNYSTNNVEIKHRGGDRARRSKTSRNQED